MLALLAIVAAQQSASEDKVQDSPAGDVTQQAFAGVDAKMQDLQAKLEDDRAEFTADDRADGVDPSQFSSKAMSLLELDPSGALAGMDAKLESLVQEMRKQAASPLDDTETPQERALDAKLRAEAGGVPSSFAEVKPRVKDQTFAEVDKELRTLQLRIKRQQQRYAGSSFLQTDEARDAADAVSLKAADANKEARAAAAQLEEMIKADAERFRQRTSPGGLLHGTDPEEAAGLLQQMHELAANLHHAAAPSSFLETSPDGFAAAQGQLEALEAQATRDVAALKKAQAGPSSSFVQSQVDTLFHNIKVAKQVMNGERAMPPELSKMLAGIRARDEALRRKADKLHLPKQTPDFLKHTHWPKTGLVQTGETAPGKTLVDMEHELKALVAEMKAGPSSLAETAPEPRVEAQLEQLVAKIGAFTGSFEKAHPSSFLEETDIAAFRKLDGLRDNLASSEAHLREARRLLPFADESVEADIKKAAADAEAARLTERAEDTAD